MARTRKEIVLQLRKLRSELRKTDDHVLRETCMAGINDLLDERLEQKGAHPAECSCHECCRAVADRMAHRLGECTDPRDVADDTGW